jgi:hypothetical protein
MEILIGGAKMGAEATKTKLGFELVHNYLNVCNAAAEEHRHSLVYRPIIAAYDSVFANRPVGIDIYDHDPDEIETTITIRLVNGEFVPAPGADVHPSFHLKLGRHYMEDVVAHRDEYIRHPEKLDWDWIKSRIGIEPHHGPARGANMRPPKKRRYEAPTQGANMRPRSGRTE